MDERQFKGVWIPKEIWMAKDLSIQEKVILVEIDSFENEQGCFASNNYFAKFFNLTPSRVSQIINSLIQKQYLEVEYIKEGKEIKTRILRIKRPPYPEVFNFLNRGIKFSKGGYLENCEDININTNNIIKKNNISNDILLKESREIIEYLNKKTNKHYQFKSSSTIRPIKTRLKEGFTLDDFRKVIDNKCNDWLNTNMEKYLRPSTLFGTKFEGYLNEKPQQPKKETQEEHFQRILAWAEEEDRKDRERLEKEGR